MSSNVQRIVIVLAGFLGLVAGCGPAYMTAAAHPSRQITGPLAPVIAQAPGRDDGYTGAIGLGLGNKHLGFEANVHALNIGPGTFSAPVDDAMGRWATVQTTLEARWTWLRWRRLGLMVKGGGTHAAVIDKMTGDRALGIGYTYAAGVEVMFRNVTVWADASQTWIRFVDGPAMGDSELRGITVGLSLWR
jgi:hypothetical protein